MTGTPEKKRVIALVGHGASGKTSLGEAVLFTGGAVTRLGSVDQGTAVLDSGEEELRRKVSIDVATGKMEWRDHSVQFIDTPGYPDFTGEVRCSLPAVDGVVVVVGATDGVQVGTEIGWDIAGELDLPRLIFVNKMDKENVEFGGLVEEMRKLWGSKVVVVQMPMGKESAFEGVVDLVAMRARKGPGAGEEIDIPGDLAAEAETLRGQMVEGVAEADDALLEKYLEAGELTQDEVAAGLRQAVMSGQIVPVLCGSATANIGTGALLDAVLGLLPSPLDRVPLKVRKGAEEEESEWKPQEGDGFCGYVYKVMADPHLGELSFFRVYSGTLSAGDDVWNASRSHDERIGQLVFMQGKNREELKGVGAGDLVAVAKLKGTSTRDTLCARNAPVRVSVPVLPEPLISIALVPESKKDQERLAVSLAKLTSADPTLRMRVDKEFGQTVLAGQGEVHLDVVVERLRTRYGVAVSTEKTKVAYRETIRGSAKVQGRYKRQSGGRGQYGDVWIEISPLERGGGFEFANSIVGGSIPGKFIPAVEKGIRGAMRKGVVAGCQVVDLRISLYDGTFHAVDSSDLAFQIAGSLAFKKGVQEARPVLLEPIVSVEVVVPEQFLGDITSDMNGRRGRIVGIEPMAGRQKIKAQVPIAEMDRYSTDLKSITQGRGSYGMEFSRYEEVPERIAAGIVAQASKKEAEE